MYTSIVSCNVKRGGKLCSSSWSGLEDVVSQQPGTPTEEEGQSTGLEKLIQSSGLFIERCHDIGEVLAPFHSPTCTKFYSVQDQGRLLYYACLKQPPRENCCDRERKYKLELIDTNGELLLIVEKPYNLLLDMTSNCWVCCCCACGVVGGSASVKTVSQSLNTLIGSLMHTYSCYKPCYTLHDQEGYELMRIEGSGCGDCLPQYRRSTDEFIVKSEEERVGSLMKMENKLHIKFNRSLGLKWKLLVLAGGVVVDLMYFGGGQQQQYNRGRTPSSAAAV